MAQSTSFTRASAIADQSAPDAIRWVNSGEVAATVSHV